MGKPWRRAPDLMRPHPARYRRQRACERVLRPGLCPRATGATSVAAAASEKGLRDAEQKIAATFTEGVYGPCSLRGLGRGAHRIRARVALGVLELA